MTNLSQSKITPNQLSWEDNEPTSCGKWLIEYECKLTSIKNLITITVYSNNVGDIIYFDALNLDLDFKTSIIEKEYLPDYFGNYTLEYNDWKNNKDKTYNFWIHRSLKIS